MLSIADSTSWSCEESSRPLEHYTPRLSPISPTMSYGMWGCIYWSVCYWHWDIDFWFERRMRGAQIICYFCHTQIVIIEASQCVFWICLIGGFYSSKVSSEAAWIIFNVCMFCIMRVASLIILESTQCTDKCLLFLLIRIFTGGRGMRVFVIGYCWAYLYNPWSSV